MVQYERLLFDLKKINPSFICAMSLKRGILRSFVGKHRENWKPLHVSNQN